MNILGLALFGWFALLEPASASRAVTWSAPPACPSQEVVTRLVERYVQRPLRQEAVRADVSVVREPAGELAMVLVLLRDDAPPATETLRDRDCQVLAEAAALKIATAIDPQATVASLAEDSEEEQLGVSATRVPSETPPSKPTAPPSSPAGPTPTVPPGADDGRARSAPPGCGPGRSLLRRPEGLAPRCAGLGARFGVQLGPLPRIGPGLGGHLAALWPRVRLEIGAVHWFEQAARLDDSGIGGDLRLTTADVTACGRLGRNGGELDLCPSVEVGAFRGIGVGVARPREDRLLWAAFVAQARGGWSPLRRLALFAQVAAVVPFARYRFQVGGVGTVHRPAVAGFRALLGTEIRLP